jgi:hypothetical protein
MSGSVKTLSRSIVGSPSSPPSILPSSASTVILLPLALPTTDLTYLILPSSSYIDPSTMMESNAHSSARSASLGFKQWSRWTDIGTEAACATSAAYLIKAGPWKCKVQGKNWIMAGERHLSAALITARTPSALYLPFNNISLRPLFPGLTHWTAKPKESDKGEEVSLTHRTRQLHIHPCGHCG